MRRGTLEADKYLAEVNLGNLENSAGDLHAYWLLAIQTARRAFQLCQACLEAAGLVAMTEMGT